MNGIYGINEAEGLDTEDYPEDYPEFEEGILDEARRPRRPIGRPVRTPPAGSAYQDRSGPGGPVTQQQLKTALGMVARQIKATGDAVKVVDARVRRVADEQGRLSVALRKENADRKKEILCVRKDLQSTRETSAILPLLTSFAGDSPIAALAPLFLLGGDVTTEGSCGTGGLGASGSGLGGLMNGGLTMPLLLLAFSGALGGSTTGAKK